MLFAATNCEAYYIKKYLIILNLNFIKTNIINVILIMKNKRIRVFVISLLF